MSELQDRIRAERERRRMKEYADAVTNVSGVRDIGTSLTQMPTFGFGDEATSAVAAGGAKLTGDKRPYGEIYSDILDSENARMSTFREEHPKDSLTAELVGGFSTGGLGLSRAIAAMRGGKTLGTLGGLGTVAGESAAYGAGSARQGERGEGALFGGALGLGTAGVLKLAGAGARGISKRGTAQDLGSGESFIPLNVADPGWRGTYAQEVLGRTFGGGPLIKEQTQHVMGKDVAEAAKLQEKLDALPNRFSQAKDAIREKFKQELARRSAARKAGITAAQEQAKGIVESVPHIAPQQVKVPTFESTRRKIARDALPAEETALREKIQGMPELMANDVLKGWWGKKGFSAIKQRMFAGPATLITKLDDMMNQSPELVIELGDVSKKVKAMAEAIGKGESVTIDGDSLMAMRNVFARGANEKVADKFGKKMLRSVANEFDKSIAGQLDDAGKKYFREQKRAYKSNVIYQNSVGKAFTHNAGKFTPEQALGVEQRIVGTTAKTPYGSESRATQDAQKQAKLQQEAANEAAKAEQRTADQTARKQAASVLREARAARDAQAQKDSLEVSKGKRAALYGLKEKSTIAEAETALKATKEKIAAIKNLAPEEKQAALSKLFTTTMVGSLPLGLLGLTVGAPGVGLVGGALLGTKISKGLAGEKGQKLVAGQLQWQENMAKALRERSKDLERYYRTGYRAAADQE